MPAEWYYYQNETRVGPVESEQIQQLLSTCQLRANDLVWRNGMPGWSPILSVPELAPTVPLQRYGDPPLHRFRGTPRFRTLLHYGGACRRRRLPRGESPGVASQAAQPTAPFEERQAAP